MNKTELNDINLFLFSWFTDSHFPEFVEVGSVVHDMMMNLRH